MYRSQQIHHSLAMETIKYILPVVIPVAECLLVLTILVVVKLTRTTDPITLIAASLLGLFIVILLKIAIDSAAEITTNSKSLQNLQAYSTRFRKIDRVFFKSCYPLSIRIGGCFSLHPNTFPRIVNDVVISNVINLLVAF